jgi:hypothetical protein
MERRIRLGVLFFLLAVMPSCQSRPEPLPRGDFTRVTLYATGFGVIKTWTGEERIRGIQQAKADVAQKLEEQILALKTDNGTVFREKVMQENAMKKVSAYVRGAEIIAIENNKEGVAISSRLVLGDPFKAALGLLRRKDLSPHQGQGMRGDSF